MKNQICSTCFALFLFLLLIKWPSVEAQTQKGAKMLLGDNPYTIYKCSPLVSSNTKAKLTINIFEKGGDGGAPSQCDNQFHPDNTPVVALSTGWFNNKYRCLNYITIHGNGRSVKAKVVDECDSTLGRNGDHDYQPPCRNNIVDASKAIWKALGVAQNDWGE
ncbi:kiwellin-1-like [Juglans regia]|uniref:Kiwellin-1-like n=1 Tax=Juglans regia TaxID=51240 RepID=A0A6P9ENT8_JUGRE|nr:kiwellin-1-like [Juglans regia]